MSGSDSIAQVVAAFGDSWTRRDATALCVLWDLTDDRATYLAAGNAQAFIGGAAIRAYVEGGCQTFSRIVMRPGDVHARLLNADLGVAFCSLDWAIQEKPSRKPFGGRVRVTMLLRKIDAAWRIFHYAEAPLAPLLTLQRYYEDIAVDGLGAIPPRGTP